MRAGRTHGAAFAERSNPTIRSITNYVALEDIDPNNLIPEGIRDAALQHYLDLARQELETVFGDDLDEADITLRVGIGPSVSDTDTDEEEHGIDGCFEVAFKKFLDGYNAWEREQLARIAR